MTRTIKLGNDGRRTTYPAPPSSQRTSDSRRSGGARPDGPAGPEPGRAARPGEWWYRVLAPAEVPAERRDLAERVLRHIRTEVDTAIGWPSVRFARVAYGAPAARERQSGAYVIGPADAAGWADPNDVIYLTPAADALGLAHVVAHEAAHLLQAKRATERTGSAGSGWAELHAAREWAEDDAEAFAAAVVRTLR